MESSIIPPDKMEPILIKLFLSDPKYALLLHNKFNQQWFVDVQLGMCAKFIFTFHSKYMKLPSIETLNLLINKQLNDEQIVKNTLLKLKSINGIELDKYDSEYLDSEVINYLKNIGIFYTITSNIDNITENHSVANIMECLQFLTSMNFDADVGFDFLEDIDILCKELQNPEARLSTGWPMLDQIMNGGLYADGRCLALFLGQTHIGKSLFLSNMASNMLKNNKFVVIISLEMSEIVCATRIAAHITGANINKLEHHTELIVDKAEQIKNNRNSAKLVIKEFPPDTISCSHIKNYLDRIISLYGRTPDAIYIDYLQLLISEHGSKGHENSYTKYRAVATEMRKLSYIFPCPIISVIQSNRESHDTTDPGVNNTSDSYGIPMVADYIGGIYQNEGDRDACMIRVATLKNRLGGMIGKVVNFNINYKSLALTDISEISQVPEELAEDIMSQLEEIDL